MRAWGMCRKSSRQGGRLEFGDPLLEPFGPLLAQLAQPLLAVAGQLFELLGPLADLH